MVVLFKTCRPAAWLLICLTLAWGLGGCAADPSIDVDDRQTHPMPLEDFVPRTYLIGPGDQLEVLYHIDPGHRVKEYVIDTEDTLRIDFFYYPIMSRTVRVRPDGFITMPRVGDIKAGGKRPRDLAEEVTEIYKPYLARPVATVEVLEFSKKVEELKQAIVTNDRGQSRLVVVRPDGMISLPYINDIHAAGRTADELSKAIDEKYKRYLSMIMTTVAVLQANSNQIYIMGMVEKPNFYTLSGPTTLTQALAIAGGLSSYADHNQIVVITRDKDGRPLSRIINMDDIIGQANIGADLLLRQYDVVYVPRTGLGDFALTMDAIWRILPVSFGYDLGGVDQTFDTN